MENINELNNHELINLKGGWVQYTPHGVAIWLGYEILSNWSDVKSGIKDGFNDGVKIIGAK